MTTLAHFTPAELPGTLAVLLLGVSFGVLIAARRSASRPMLAAGASLLALAGLGYAGDAGGWGETVRIAIDAFFLLAAAALVALTVRLSGSPR